MGSEPAGPKKVPFDQLAFQPRFAYGEMASLAEVAGAGEGGELGVGFVRLENARIPWTIRYDEVLIVLEGSLRILISDRTLEAGPRDSLWLPAGTALIYEAEEALVVYGIHPVDWAAREAAP